MKVLSVDSSSVTASVALVEDEKIIAEFFMDAGLTHSQTLAPMIDSILSYSGTKPSDVDLYAVTTGPGSFTGLRIGVSTIKAMALANNKPCAQISSLEALAYNSLGKNTLVCASLDARRDQIYSALFRIKNNEVYRVTPDEAKLVENLVSDLEKFDENIEFVGDGAEICYNRIMQNDKTCKYSLAPKCSRYVAAHNVAYLAQKQHKLGASSDACRIKLNYLRVPQAERLLKEKLYQGQEVSK